MRRVFHSGDFGGDGYGGRGALHGANMIGEGREVNTVGYKFTVIKFLKGSGSWNILHSGASVIMTQVHGETGL